jgi:hypothetical protein
MSNAEAVARLKADRRKNVRGPLPPCPECEHESVSVIRRAEAIYIQCERCHHVCGVSSAGL